MSNMIQSAATDSSSSSSSISGCEWEPIGCGIPRAIACKVGNSVSQVAKTGQFGCPNGGVPRRCPHRTAPGPSHLEIPHGNLRVFTLEELEKATDRFSSQRAIRPGGFGRMYKGCLPNGSVVAIKVRSEKSCQGTREFLAEIRSSERISAASNGANCFVPALGYCHPSKKKDTMMIVYPFMVNGDLGSYLDVDGKRRSRDLPDWPTRKCIALGVARGIFCLHELRILHCDIKPMNILLDENFKAYIADFGLAKDRSYDLEEKETFLFEWDSCESSIICGTLGYMAPELASNGRYSRRSDVFAFGVTLMQLITRKKTWIIDDTEEFAGSYLVEWVKDLYKNKKLEKIMDPEMGGEYDGSELNELIKLSLVCTQHEAKRRPDMSEVVSILETGGNDELRERWERYEYRERPYRADGWTDEWDSYTVTHLNPEELSGAR